MLKPQRGDMWKWSESQIKRINGLHGLKNTPAATDNAVCLSLQRSDMSIAGWSGLSCAPAEHYVGNKT